MSKATVCISLGIVGALCGLFISNTVVGYQGPQSGWFGDLSPLTNAVQLIFYAGLGFGIGSGLPSFLAKILSRRDPDSAFKVGAIATLALMLGTTGYLGIRHAVEEAAHHREVEKQMVIEDKTQAAYLEGCNYSKKHMDWLRYPRIDKSADNPPGGLREGPCFYMCTPADPPEVAVNYYLSHADSWQQEGNSFRIYEVLGSEGYEVYVSAEPHGLISIVPKQVQAKPKLQHVGPGNWTPAVNNTPPAGGEATKPSQLDYPGASRESTPDQVRMYTKDSVEQVVAFYQSQGAVVDAAVATPDQTQMSMKAGERTAKITITHVFDSSGANPGTLIVVTKG